MPQLVDIPEAIRVEAYLRAMDGHAVYWITYTPVEECFFQGDDPFVTTRHTPQCPVGHDSAPRTLAASG